METLVRLVEDRFQQHVPDTAIQAPAKSPSEFRWRARKAWFQHEGRIHRTLVEMRDERQNLPTALVGLTA